VFRSGCSIMSSLFSFSVIFIVLLLLHSMVPSSGAASKFLHVPDFLHSILGVRNSFGNLPSVAYQL
jgi:hypothetical protein